MSNIYSEPEKFGLEIVGEIEDEPDYSFDMFVVWKDNKGSLYYGQDSGCSCPSPFENIESVSELEKIDKNNFDVFETAVMRFNKEYSENARPSLEDRKNLIGKVYSLLKK